MRTYTEKELLKAVEYACGMQKADDYQTAGDILLVNFWANELKTEKLLNTLYETDDNQSLSLTIDDINEYIDEKK